MRHFGLDIRGTITSVWVGIKQKTVAGGASTRVGRCPTPTLATHVQAFEQRRRGNRRFDNFVEFPGPATARTSRQDQCS